MSQAYSNPARITGLTDQQALHLDAWIVRTQSVERRGDAILAILAFLAEYPEMVDEGRSWTEILFLAERFLADAQEGSAE